MNLIPLQKMKRALTMQLQHELDEAFKLFSPVPYELGDKFDAHWCSDKLVRLVDIKDPHAVVYDLATGNVFSYPRAALHPKGVQSVHLNLGGVDLVSIQNKQIVDAMVGEVMRLRGLCDIDFTVVKPVGCCTVEGDSAYLHAFVRVFGGSSNPIEIKSR